MAAKIVIIGKGEFGNSLAQGMDTASIAKTDTSVTVEQISATKLFAMDTDSMAQILANAAYIMYCGKNLSEHAHVMGSALRHARSLSSLPEPEGKAPLLEFMDWSNPDPTNESYDGAVVLSAAGVCDPSQVIWKVTGVSSLDAAGHEGRQSATVYSSSPGIVPSIDIAGIIWKPRHSKSDLLSEVADRLLTRADVDRWYDASFLGLAILLFGFGYAFTRYSEWVNGGYPYTMMPLYVLDKAVAWTALWMISVSPFSGNLLTVLHVFSNSGQANGVDKFAGVLSLAIMIVPALLFALPWIVWAIIRSSFSSWNKHIIGLSLIKSMLIDMVSLKTESGIVGFGFLLTHAFMGTLIAVPHYKSGWFDEKSRFYGNNEVSMASGVIAFTLVTLVTIRSLIGKGSWMKLKPLYAYVSPLAVFLATFHVIMMGYKGWDDLFKYSTKKGQPSITFVSTMFPLGVIATHLLLVILGTKRNVRRVSRVEKHSATNDALTKYDEAKDAVCGTDETKRTVGISSASDEEEGQSFDEFMAYMSDSQRIRVARAV